MAASLERRLREARACHEASDAEGVERLCGEILRDVPDHPDALHLLGLLRIRQRRPAEAVAMLEAAARQAAGSAAIQLDLGVACSLDGRHDDAVAAFSRAVSLDPGNAGAHVNLGNALSGAGRAQDALASYRQALAIDPANAAARFNHGNQLKHLGRLDEAIREYEAALALAPDHADARLNLGTLHQRRWRLDEAARCYEQVLEREPAHLQALLNLGAVRLMQARPDAAIASWQLAMRLHPGRTEPCLRWGNLCVDQGSYAEAQALFEQAVARDPADSDARNDLATALSAQHQWDAAIAQYRHALELLPGSAQAEYNLGLAHLFLRGFEEGWRGYERRLDCPKVRTGMRKGESVLALYERLPRWRGPEAEPREEVAIWAEQGIGDQILFSTLIPELIGAGVPFVYEVDRRLLGAYQRAFPGARFVPLNKEPVGALKLTRRVLLAGSLPGLFRRAPASFARQPARLLAARPERVAHYRSALAQRGGGMRVALSWRSKAERVRLGPVKSVPLADFAPLLAVPGVIFADVQYGDTRAERGAAEAATGRQLAHFDEVDYHKDLEEVLAILEASDLLITTSNATAHLAGALGKRTWLLYLADRAPFFYWAHDGSHRCLWYPSVEIISGREFTQWDALLRHVSRRLAAVASGAAP